MKNTTIARAMIRFFFNLTDFIYILIFLSVKQNNKIEYKHIDLKPENKNKIILIFYVVVNPAYISKYQTGLNLRRKF